MSRSRDALPRSSRGGRVTIPPRCRHALQWRSDQALFFSALALGVGVTIAQAFMTRPPFIPCRKSPLARGSLFPIHHISTSHKRIPCLYFTFIDDELGNDIKDELFPQEATSNGIEAPAYQAQHAGVIAQDSLYDFGSANERELEGNAENPVSGGDTISSATKFYYSSPVNVSYYYLRDSVGMSELAMWRITHEAGSALAMSSATIQRKVETLQRLLNLSMDEIRKILETQPTLLHLSVDDNIIPTIAFLRKVLNVTAVDPVVNSAGRRKADDVRSLVLYCPSILTYRLGNIQAKVDFFTLALGYTVDECKQLLLKEPKLIRSSVQDSLLPHLRFLRKDLELSRSDVKAITMKYPRILLYSLDNNLIPKLIFYFVMTLQFELPQVHRLLRTYPQVLDYNLDRHIRPIGEYLMQEVEFHSGELRSMVSKWPRLLTYSLAKIKRIVGYLRYELGFDASQVKRTLYQAPQIAGLSIDGNLRPTVAYLRKALSLSGSPDSTHGSDEETILQRILVGMPTVLVLNCTTNLGPKIEYLREFCSNGSNRNLQELLLRLPAMLGYSLTNRIIPRVEAMKRFNVDCEAITVGIPMPSAAFDAWLHRKALKRKKETEATSIESTKNTELVLSPANFLPRLPSSSSYGVIETSPSAASPPSQQPIMHWTRPRRPRS
jgi:mTERF